MNHQEGPLVTNSRAVGVHTEMKIGPVDPGGRSLGLSGTSLGLIETSPGIIVKSHHEVVDRIGMSLQLGTRMSHLTDTEMSDQAAADLEDRQAGHHHIETNEVADTGHTEPKARMITGEALRIRNLDTDPAMRQGVVDTMILAVEVSQRRIDNSLARMITMMNIKITCETNSSF